MELFKNFWKEEEGQDLIEYALLLGFISLAVITALQAVQTAINATYTSVASMLPSA